MKSRGPFLGSAQTQALATRMKASCVSLSSQSSGFPRSHVHMWELDHKKPERWRTDAFSFPIMVLEKTFESPLDSEEIKAVHPKGNQPWIFIGRTETETPMLWPPEVKSRLIEKRPWCWERLRAGGEGDDGGWDGWMASPTQWTWVWASSGRWWRTEKEKPGLLQSMGSQRVGYDLLTEQQQHNGI